MNISPGAVQYRGHEAGAEPGAIMKTTNPVRFFLCMLTLAWSLFSAAAEVRQPIVAGDIEIYYGVMPASVLLAHPSDHAERTMHGGARLSRNSYHLVVSIFDTKKRERVADAQVQASVSEPGLVPQTKPLQTMAMAGVITYGNYFTMSGPGPFLITLDIKRQHGGAPVQTGFEHRHR
jgi:hypothetical protein